MNVIVKKVNYKRGLVVFESESYDCGYFEILDTIDLEEDDELEGIFKELGETTIIKKNTGENIDVFI